MAKKYWLMKTEPDEFSIDDLKSRPNQTERWNGVRNYQARNHMRSMSVGDEVLFYHSSCVPPGVAGIATIAKPAYPDATALDPKADYYDPKASEEKNPWSMVDVKFKRKFKRFIPLDELRAAPGLEGMLVIKKGMRLSVQPVTAEEFAIVAKLASA